MATSTIYLAGGCFWGMQKYLKLIPGVTGTEVGFANGHVESPSYKEVYTDATGHAETVKVCYDPDVLELGDLVRFFFKAIDPTSVNRQGEDSGTRYRTGVYYTDLAEGRRVREIFDEEAREAAGPIAVECLPLECYYPAEDYHQDYLDKNDGGYCHLRPELFEYARHANGKAVRIGKYQDALSKAGALLQADDDVISQMANLAALLHRSFGFWWTGFYRVAGGELTLGPFQGPPACTRIPFGKGVCGTAWKERRTVVVPDVEQFPGHIACSSESRSEIVVPVWNGGEIVAVLDIDSERPATFTETDARWLEEIVKCIHYGNIHTDTPASR